MAHTEKKSGYYTFLSIIFNIVLMLVYLFVFALFVHS